MLGRTHFFIGISAALAVMQPSSMPTLVAGAGAAAIGGMISDIDSGTSQAHREADKIMTAAIAVTAIVILADYKFHVGIYERLMRNSSIARLLTGAWHLSSSAPTARRSPTAPLCIPFYPCSCSRHA